MPTHALTAKGPASGPGMAGKPLEAALWMLGAALFIAIGNAMIRHVSGELHPFEIVFFRNLFSLMFMLPWIAAVGLGRLRTGRAGLYASRSATSLVAMLCWFYSVTHMPLPDATALSFTIPLFVTAGAALFLNETVRARRWAAVLVGLAGVMIVIRPDDATLDPTILVMLLHCVAAAITTLQVRALATSDGVMVVVAYMGLFLTPMALVPALFVWEWPSWTALGWLVLLGGVLTLGQLAMTRAFKLAPASAMMPYDYARLPFTALLAWPLFGEAMDLWGWVGAGVIAASALYTAHRDAAQSRAERAAAAKA
ncbi:S-adenosylmethionine uptake transporter [Azospirillum brasilense]|uniref:S-adenosylmethionine uptake transporter n=1 Tax=Azospirillum brasilense TaxID=192 RepID=A0A560CI14_AZOBR|nr:DMT family transporter [Azospirillum brasilense]TWA84487.1 S-adenosylmethionine uptake transporter [Azospirillum brasilense]